VVVVVRFFNDNFDRRSLQTYIHVTKYETKNGDFLRPVFSVSRVQHISDVHSKFALRPHHVWKYGSRPISDR